MFDSLPFYQSSSDLIVKFPFKLFVLFPLGLALIIADVSFFPSLIPYSANMYDHFENNPYFSQPAGTTQPHDQPPSPSSIPASPQLKPQRPSQPPGWPQSQGPQTLVPPPPRSQRRQKSFPRQEPGDHFPLHNLKQPQPLRPTRPTLEQQPPERPPKSHHSPPLTPPAPPPQRKQTIDVPLERQYPQTTSPEDPDRVNQRQGLRLFPPRKTRFPTWLIGIFCAIFWVVIIVGGLIVLIVYLVYRPHLPRFDIPAASLNAAYLDVGDFLNADVTLLVNFTNPNRKVRVDFSSVILDLYYGNNLIATQFIEPFSANSKESKFAHAQMVSSQVKLPVADSERLRKQIESNGLVLFEVRGLFRTRSNLGSFLRYSYWLYGHCTIALGGPPAGVLRATKCWTKR